jgi:hypothetical protein
MAGGFANDTTAFLDGETLAVPPHTLDLLAALSAESLESLASAAASEMTKNLVHQSNNRNATSPGDNEVFAAMCAIVAACARDGSARTQVERR